MALMLIGAAAADAWIEPRPLAPEHLTTNFASRSPENPQPIGTGVFLGLFHTDSARSVLSS
jgi:hypothetical protein